MDVEKIKYLKDYVDGVNKHLRIVASCPIQFSLWSNTTQDIEDQATGFEISDLLNDLTDLVDDVKGLKAYYDELVSELLTERGK